MMVPVGRLLLLRTAAKSELVAAMAWLTMPALLGPVVGPPVGGFIVTYFNWRWTFFINIPVGLIGLVAVTLFIQDFREPTARQIRHPRPDAHRPGADMRDVRAGNRWPRPGRARGDRGDDRRRPGDRLPVLPARPPDPSAAARFHPDAAALLRPVVQRHDAVPHRHRRHSVPAADDAAGGLRQFRGAKRPDHLRQFGRCAGDEAGARSMRCGCSASATP